MTYGPFIFLIKPSLFFLFLEAFSTLRWLRHFVYGGIFATGIFHFSISIALGGLCAPRNGYIKANLSNYLLSGSQL